MTRRESNEIVKQMMNPRSKIEELGKQLGLNTEHIHSILNNVQQFPEPLSLSSGPPHYSGAFYGTVSIDDFHIAP